MTIKKRLVILKHMILLAEKERQQKSRLNQDLEYNPSFGKDYLLYGDDVPKYTSSNGYVVKITRKDGVKYY